MRPTAAEKTSQEHASTHRRILCDVIDNKQQGIFVLGGRNRSMQRSEALLFSFYAIARVRKRFRLFRDLDQMEADRSCIGGMPFFIYFYASSRQLRAYRHFRCLHLGQVEALGGINQATLLGQLHVLRYQSHCARDSKGPITVVGLIGLMQNWSCWPS